MDIDTLRFPVGKWISPGSFEMNKIAEQMLSIRSFPEKISDATSGRPDIILDTPYRPGGWTVRQVVHHCADSHMNALIRFKLALTEDAPTIKPYLEAKWAELEDAKMPIGVSLRIIEGVHARWTVLLNAMKETDWQRGFIHPEHGHELKLFQSLHLYAWHCTHHLAHVQLVTAKS